jgi:hypothetical protein
LAIDQAARPYVVISYWWQEGLRYAWCDSNCLDTNSWQVTQGPQLEVQAPELVLNAQGQPRVVYHTTEYDETGNNPDNSLYYLWCNVNCRTMEAQWERVRVENSENLRAEWPKSIPSACATGEWHQMESSLTLSPAGIANVAVDLGYIGPCQYDAAAGTWKPGENFAHSTVWRAGRLLAFPAP